MAIAICPDRNADLPGSQHRIHFIIIQSTCPSTHLETNRGKLTHDVIIPDGNGDLVINGGLHGNHPAIEGLIGRLGAPNVPGWPVRLIVPDDDQVSPL